MTCGLTKIEAYQCGGLCDSDLPGNAGGFNDGDDDDNFGEAEPFEDDDGGDMDVDALAEAAAEGAYPGTQGAWQTSGQVCAVAVHRLKLSNT